MVDCEKRLLAEQKKNTDSYDDIFFFNLLPKEKIVDLGYNYYYSSQVILKSQYFEA